MGTERDRLLAGPHRRYNPLLDQWVLVSPHRLSRPWLGQIEPAVAEGLPQYDPGCYLCPGNTRANGTRNPAYTSTFAFDNDFPALTGDGFTTCAQRSDSAAGTGGETGSHARRAGGLEPATPDLLVATPQAGRCRVLCFSPRHDLTLARMDQPAIRAVVDAWANEVDLLSRLPFVRYVQVFENKGAAMGCSNPHPHCQVWASAEVPDIPARKIAMQDRYFVAHGRDLLGDYLDRELQDGVRVVCRNEAWVVLVPFWAVWPFEVMVVPVRAVDDLRALTPGERDSLADILRRLNVRYDNLFSCPFPYSMGWHGRPFDGRAHPGCRLHAVYFPPLLRSATVRKFLVGYEMTGEPQRDLTAEAAAERLRAQPETHHLAYPAPSPSA